MRLMTLTLLIALTLPARAGDYIAVHATGWVDAVPDMLTLSVAAQAAGKDMEALQQAVDKTARLVTQAAREQGVAEADIDTAQLSINPEYQWRDGQRFYMGQIVRREVTIVLRDVDKYGVLVQALSRFDLQEMRQPQLGHSKIHELELEALEHALKNGIRKAGRIAAGIDATLGKVMQVEEQGVAPPSPAPRMMAAEAMAGAGAPDIQFGQQRIQAAVTMRFAIN